VTPVKQRRIAEAARRYLNRSKDSRLSPDLEISFDVVAVTFDKGETRIEWFPQAFIPMFC
jgi:Holliday junction resolvase-like predicted endonuclease